MTVEEKTEDEKKLEELFRVYMMIMSKEQYLGMNLMSSTLTAFREEEFQKIIKILDDSSLPEKTAKSILLGVRELNKIPENEATTIALIAVIKKAINTAIESESSSIQKE